MKAWDRFLKDVLPKVPGCPEPVAEHALLRAAQEFFETTGVWKLWLDDVTTVADIIEYEIPLEPNSELVRVVTATLDGRQIAVRPVETLPADWQTYPDTLEQGVHTTDKRTLILLPTPEADLVLKIEAALKPDDAATGIEDHFFAHYASHIADGAVALLKEHPKTTYEDADGAGFYRSKFEGHMAVAGLQRFRGYSGALPRRRGSFF